MPAPPRDETPIDSDPPGESEPAVPMRILDGIADGLVTLDREWRYTYVNAHAARIFGRPRSELIGKCVWDLFPFIVGTEMERQMRRAADEQVTCEFQGHDAAMERSYENRAFPTPDGGVAVYFRDVTERRRNERLIESARAYAEGIVTTVREPLLILDDDLRVVSANRSFYATFQVGPAETEGRAVYELGDGQWDIPGLRTLLEEIVPANSWFDDFEVEHDFEQIGRKTMLLNARRFPPEGPFKLLLLAIEDITDRRQAEEKDRRSEALLAEAQELAHVGSWNWDLATDLITWSDEHYRIFGLERQEGPMTFERGISVIHPDDLPRVRRTVDEAQRDHEPYDCSLRLLRRDGSVRFVHSRGLAVYDQDGKPIRMYGTVQDVTDRTHAEEALRQVNTRVELALRGSDIGIWESEYPDGTLESARVVFTNVWEQLGYGKPASTPDFAAGSSLIHPDERDRMGDALRAYLSGESPTLEFEHRVRRADGSYLWMLNRGVAIREAESKSIRVIGSRVDITQRKLAEEKICSLNADMQSRIDEMITLLNILPTGVWIGNEDCSQITGNGAAYKMMGLNPGINVSVTNPQPEVPVGMRIFVNGEEVPPEDAPMQQVARTGKPSYNFEHELLFPDGTRKSIYGSAAPLFDQQGRVRKVIGAYADFTDRKRLEEALLRAKEAAEAANRSKDEFLANVSHEIRTPFGAILGMTELVLDTPLTDDQRQCLETVKSAADSLLGLVDDLLDFERIEAGKLELAPADFALRPMMADALRAQTVQARGKGLELVWKVEPDAPDALVGDAGRLRQVLLNLVGNAIKFTRHGEVAVRVGVAECPVPDEEAVLRFAVRDTGIGIPPDGRERIFRAFEQADSSTTREYGGTGLGLTIATRLVGLMGGTIAVESEPGKGSTFSFTARFGRPPHRPEQVVARRSDAPHVAAAPGPAVTPLRILVAEDSEFNVRHLQRLLGKKGHHVRLANNGREALALLGIEGRGSGIEGPLVPDIDVLLLDMHMPELDGFQVVRAIRERERAAGGHLPVIALTARSRPEDREKCLAAGMDDFLTKPIRAAELFATIERVASAFGGPGP